MESKPRMPWIFLGGYLLFFLGLAACLIGAFEFSGARGDPPTDSIFSLGVAGLGIALSAVGSLVMARSERIRGCHMSGLIVCFVMTPIPALIGLGINFLGTCLRKTTVASLQMILVGVGVFLLALAGHWFWEILHADKGGQEIQSMAWVFLANFGIISLLLAATPLVFGDHRQALAKGD